MKLCLSLPKIYRTYRRFFFIRTRCRSPWTWFFGQNLLKQNFQYNFFGHNPLDVIFQTKSHVEVVVSHSGIFTRPLCWRSLSGAVNWHIFMDLVLFLSVRLCQYKHYSAVYDEYINPARVRGGEWGDETGRGRKRKRKRKARGRKSIVGRWHRVTSEDVVT